MSPPLHAPLPLFSISSQAVAPALSQWIPPPAENTSRLFPRSCGAANWERRNGARSERVNPNAGNITASRQRSEALAPSHAGRAVSKPMSGKRWLTCLIQDYKTEAVKRRISLEHANVISKSLDVFFLKGLTVHTEHHLQGLRGKKKAKEGSNHASHRWNKHLPHIFISNQKSQFILKAVSQIMIYRFKLDTSVSKLFLSDRPSAEGSLR